MIDFAGTVPADQTFTWEQFFAMGRDHRAIVETLRAIVEAHNVTAALAVADKAVYVTAALLFFFLSLFVCVAVYGFGWL